LKDRIQRNKKEGERKKKVVLFFFLHDFLQSPIQLLPMVPCFGGLLIRQLMMVRNDGMAGFQATAYKKWYDVMLCDGVRNYTLSLRG
jgi:hypothetical protein